MIITLERTGTTDAFIKQLNQLEHDQRVQSILLLACDNNGFTTTELDTHLSQLTKPLFGGIFPEIIHDREKLTTGSILVGIERPSHVQVIPGLSDPNLDYEEMIDDTLALKENVTMFVFVDGFAQRINCLIHDLFSVYGLEFNYIGGGAGSLSFEQKPCLFTNQGLVQDSALLVMLEMESGVGVSHGWNEVAGPFKVTESQGNVIISLNWKPAFEVYRAVVEQHSKRTFTSNNFFDIAKSYPFGINKLETEKIIRDPIQVGTDNSLICVGEVPQESFVHIMTGDVDSLVDAAEKALVLSEKSLSGDSGDKTTLFIDCISRVLFLEDQFERELQAVSRSGIPLIGALTIGEIANSRKDYLEFYNKTSVVGVLQP